MISYWHAAALAHLAYAALVVFGALMAWMLSVKTAELRWPVMIYIAIIVVMGVAAFGTGRPVLIVAALFFIVSDAVLSVELFALHKDAHWRKFTPYVVWSTY